MAWTMCSILRSNFFEAEEKRYVYSGRGSSLGNRVRAKESRERHGVKVGSWLRGLDE